MIRGKYLVKLFEMTSGCITLQVFELLHIAQVSDLTVGAELLVAALVSIKVHSYIRVLAKMNVDGRVAAEDSANISLKKVSKNDLMLPTG